MLVKHGTRTVRRPCETCGSLDLYRAHDTDRPYAVTCSRCNVNGAYVLMNRDGTAHACTGTAAPTAAPSVPDDDDDDDGTPPETTPPEIAPKADDGTAAQLRRLLGLDDAPSIDLDDIREEVAAICEQVLAGRTLPVTVHVEHADGRTVKVDGTHKVFPRVLAKAQAGINVQLVGPAGSGKTSIAAQVAQALDLPYFEQSMSPMTTKTDLAGYLDANGNYVASLLYLFFKAEDGAVFLFDEGDACDGGVFTLCNVMVAQRRFTFPNGETLTLAPNSVFLMACNTYGTGPDRVYQREQLDGASLNRWWPVYVDYDNAVEDAICAATGYDGWSSVVTVVRGLRANVAAHALPLIFSPRQSVDICKALRVGDPWDLCVAERLRGGMSDAEWAKVSNGVKVTL